MSAIVNIIILFLTVNRVAERYGVSKHGIRRWKSHGDFLSPMQVGPDCT